MHWEPIVQSHIQQKGEAKPSPTLPVLTSALRCSFLIWLSFCVWRFLQEPGSREPWDWGFVINNKVFQCRLAVRARQRGRDKEREKKVSRFTVEHKLQPWHELFTAHRITLLKIMKIQTCVSSFFTLILLEFHRGQSNKHVSSSRLNCQHPPEDKVMLHSCWLQTQMAVWNGFLKVYFFVPYSCETSLIPKPLITNHW